MQLLFDILRQNYFRSEPKSTGKTAPQKPVKPQLLWIGCSDCQVAPHEMASLHPEAIFVHQNIANQVKEGDASLESALHFAVEELQIKRIVVCGHYHCSGVKKALLEFEKEDDLSGKPFYSWINEIKYLAYRHWESIREMPNQEARLQHLIELNVLEQAEKLRNNHLISCNPDIEIFSWVFDPYRNCILDLSYKYQTIKALAV